MSSVLISTTSIILYGIIISSEPVMKKGYNTYSIKNNRGQVCGFIRDRKRKNEYIYIYDEIKNKIYQKRGN